MKIEHLISIDSAILVVYYTTGKCYQYAIAFSDLSTYQPLSIYYTSDKALELGMERIKIALGYD